MMNMLIGVVAALLVLAVVVGVVLRLQCSRNEGRRKRHKAAAQDQRTTGSGGGGSGGEKSGSSPINKLDPGGTESGDSDEKNPDVIPQPSTGKLCFTTKHHASYSGGSGSKSRPGYRLS